MAKCEILQTAPILTTHYLNKTNLGRFVKAKGGGIWLRAHNEWVRLTDGAVIYAKPECYAFIEGTLLEFGTEFKVTV